MSNILYDEILENVPDLACWNEAARWVEAGRQAALQFSVHLISEAETVPIEGSGIEQNRGSPFGLYSSKQWRKFVLAVFLSDLISYVKPIDQVNFDRLIFVMHAFPQGFRIWWIRLPDGSWWPAGYSGWYPMFETTFELFERNPERLRDRMVVPDIYSKKKNPLLYLFNYSAAPALKKSALTKRLMTRFFQDIDVQNAGGLACITVSEDGIRIAKRLGMSCAGCLNDNGGHGDSVWTKVRV